MICLPCQRVSSALLRTLVALFIAFVLLTAYMLYNYDATLMKDRQDKTQKLVASAYSLVTFYYGKMAKEELTEEQAKRYALGAIKQISLDQENYYWVMDTHPSMVMHPIQPSLDGVDLSEYVGPDGKKLFHEMVDIVRTNDAGFIEYQWTKPGSPVGQLYPKVSYIKIFKPWNWIIGSGVYVDDVNAAFRNAVYITSGLCIALVMFVLALVLTVTESLKKS